MKLKKLKKLLAQVIPTLKKRQVNLTSLSAMYWTQFQKTTELTTFRRAEAIHATPQDLSTVWRRA